jgi:hypothetical protein
MVLFVSPATNEKGAEAKLAEGTETDLIEKKADY